MNVLPHSRSNASVHLDAVRGAAALVVFFGHGRPLFLSSQLLKRSASTTTQAASSAATIPRTTIGHEAVVVFFVLSGYFVGGSVLRTMRRDSFSWTSYLLQRLTRLWVVLIPALILGLAVDHLGLHLWGATPGSIYAGLPGSFIPPLTDGHLGLKSFVGNIFFLQDTFVKPFGTNVALWSLACEFWYYLLFPLLLFALRPGISLQRRIVSALLFGGALLACGQGVTMYFPLWLAGCLMAVLPSWLPARAQRSAAGMLSLVMLATIVGCLKFQVSAYAADTAVAVVFSVLLWVVLHNQRTDLNPIYRFAARSMAKMSYTLYTVHLPLLVFACALLSPVWHPQKLSLHLLIQLSAIYGVIFLIAFAMYWLFEANTEAIRNWFHKPGERRIPGSPNNPAAKPEPQPVALQRS